MSICRAYPVTGVPAFILCLSIFFCTPATADGDTPGRALTSNEIDHLNTHVFPDGQGLPAGKGTVADGQALYAKHCAACHGNVGEGASSVELIGDRALLTTQYPDKGIAVVWPFAPTLYEYINRAMPPDSPGSFSSEELYSIVGYVLHLNELLSANAVVNKTVLSEIVMPNRDGFIDAWRPDKTN